MPHLTLEISPTISIKDKDELLSALNQTLYASGQFTLKDIKSRLYVPISSLVGDSECQQGFVYAHLAIMQGRNDAIKQQLVDRVLTTLKAYFDDDNIQYGVELSELSGFYRKG